MCRDCDDGWVAVEIKRVGTIEAVEQLTRYLGFIRADPAKAGCRGILAAQSFKPQAVTLAQSRGLACVEVDLAVLRGEREPDLTLVRLVLRLAVVVIERSRSGRSRRARARRSCSSAGTRPCRSACACRRSASSRRPRPPGTSG